jgi:predicted nucleic acid-binding protein
LPAIFHIIRYNKYSNKEKEKEMAQVYDISSKLSREKKTIKIAEDVEFTINDGKNQVLKVMELQKKESNDVNDINAVIEVLLGKEALTKIDKLNLSFSDYVIIAKALMAAATNTSLEDFDKRFRNI